MRQFKGAPHPGVFLLFLFGQAVWINPAASVVDIYGIFSPKYAQFAIQGSASQRYQSRSVVRISIIPLSA
jgi:hypothetical protein